MNKVKLYHFLQPLASGDWVVDTHLGAMMREFFMKTEVEDDKVLELIAALVKDKQELQQLLKDALK
jgi:hypothetical protein